MTTILDDNHRSGAEKLADILPSALCGNCLHSRDAHNKHNGHFMYCANCDKLCDLDEFLTIHKPTSLEITYDIQSKREYSQYKPKEAKKYID